MPCLIHCSLPDCSGSNAKCECDVTWRLRAGEEALSDRERRPWKRTKAPAPASSFSSLAGPYHSWCSYLAIDMQQAFEAGAGAYTFRFSLLPLWHAMLRRGRRPAAAPLLFLSACRSPRHSTADLYSISQPP